MKTLILVFFLGLCSPLFSQTQQTFFYSLQGGLSYTFIPSKEVSKEFLYARDIERNSYAYNDGIGLAVGSSVYYAPKANIRFSIEANLRYTRLNRFDIIANEKIFLQKNLFYLTPIAKAHFRLQQSPFWYSIGVGVQWYFYPYNIWEEPRSSIEQTIHPWVPFIVQGLRYEIADKHAFSLNFSFGLKDIITIHQSRTVLSVTLTDTTIQPQKDIYYAFRAIELSYHYYLNFN